MKWYFLFPLILQKLIWVPTRFQLSFFGRLHIQGLENLKGVKGPVIFACNHAGELDPFFVPAALSFFSRFSPIFYATREKAFYDTSGWRQPFYGGVLFKAIGGYPVYVGLHDYAKSMASHEGILADGGSLCVFPEGGITPDGHIQPAKGGVAYLAHTMEVPVVPVHIQGTYNLSAKDFFLRRRQLSVSFGTPVRMGKRGDPMPSLADFKAFANVVMREVGRL